MIKEFCKAWEEKKNNLKKFFETHPQDQYCSYEQIWKLILTKVLDEVSEWDVKNILKIDDGDYQGTLIFLVHEDCYQPSQTDYIVTWVDYGSCSGCDTLLHISIYDDGLPNELQVRDYMTLALHMVQHAKRLYEEEK